MSFKPFTTNSLKVEGSRHLQEARRILNAKRKLGEWWEFVSTTTDRTIIMRRKGRE